MGARARPLAVAAVLAAFGGSACEPTPPVPRPERPLRILVAADLPSLDPQASWDAVSSAVLGNVFDTLVRFDASLHVRAGAARSWINPDDATWRFKLDERARFHDGTPVRAQDIVFSIERLQSLADAGGRVFARDVTSVRAVDEGTVELVTRAPAALLGSLAYIPILSRRHASVAAPGTRAVGSGPYRVVAWEPGRRLQLEASPFWPHPLAVRDVEFLLRSAEIEPREVVALRPDLALFLRLATVRAIEARPPEGLRVLRAGGLAVYYLALNLRPRDVRGRRNPLADPRVREALDLATDRQAIVAGGLGGYGHVLGQLVPPEVTGYDPSLPPPEFDPARARALLAAAGRPRLSLRFLRPESEPVWLARLLVEQWARAGVALRVDVRPDEDSARALTTGDFDVAAQGYSCNSGDAVEMLSFALRSPGAGGGSGNVAGYADAEVDALADSAPRLLDPRDRLAAVRHALNLAASDRPYLPLFTVDDLHLVSRTLRWRPPPNGDVRVVDMALADD